jgi:hypothetical protein
MARSHHYRPYDAELVGCAVSVMVVVLLVPLLVRGDWLHRLLGLVFIALPSLALWETFRLGIP